MRNQRSTRSRLFLSVRRESSGRGSTFLALAVAGVAALSLSACGESAQDDEKSTKSSATSSASTSPTKAATTYDAVVGDVNVYLASVGAGDISFSNDVDGVDEAIGTVCESSDGVEPDPEFRAGFIESATAFQAHAEGVFDTLVSSCREHGFSAEPPAPVVDYVLESSCEDEYPVVFQTDPPRLVAEAKATNTGNVPVTLDVTTTWFFFGGGEAKKTKRVRLEVAADERVPFSKPSSVSELSRMAGWQHDDTLCETTAKVVE